MTPNYDGLSAKLSIAICVCFWLSTFNMAQANDSATVLNLRYSSIPVQQHKIAALYYQEGKAEFDDRDYESAIENLDHAILREPKSIRALDLRAQAHLKLFHYKQAKADFTEIINNKSGMAQTYAGRALCSVRLQIDSAAAKDLDIALKLNPQLHYTFQVIGLNAEMNGDLDGALGAYNKAISLNKNDAWSYAAKANVLYFKMDYKGAIAEFTKAIELNPNYSKAYGCRGILRNHQGDKSGALSDFNKCLTLSPRDAICAYNRGLFLVENAKLTAALKDFDLAIAVDSNDGWSYLKRGSIKTIFSDRDSALDDLNKAVVLLPTAPEAYWQRALCRWDSGDNLGAINDYKKACALDPSYTKRSINGMIVTTQLDILDSALSALGRMTEEIKDYICSLAKFH